MIEEYWRAATYANRILRGEKSSEPVERWPTPHGTLALSLHT
jgi:hypothetical protein